MSIDVSLMLKHQRPTREQFAASVAEKLAGRDWLKACGNVRDEYDGRYPQQQIFEQDERTFCRSVHPLPEFIAHVQWTNNRMLFEACRRLDLSFLKVKIGMREVGRGIVVPIYQGALIHCRDWESLAEHMFPGMLDPDLNQHRDEVYSDDDH